MTQLMPLEKVRQIAEMLNNSKLIPADCLIVLEEEDRGKLTERILEAFEQFVSPDQEAQLPPEVVDFYVSQTQGEAPAQPDDAPKATQNPPPTGGGSGTGETGSQQKGKDMGLLGGKKDKPKKAVPVKGTAKPKAKAAPKPERNPLDVKPGSRQAGFAAAIRDGGTVEDLVKKINAHCKANGTTPNDSEARAITLLGIRFLAALGKLTYKDGVYRLK